MPCFDNVTGRGGDGYIQEIDSTYIISYANDTLTTYTLRVRTLDEENYSYSNLIIRTINGETEEFIAHYTPTAEWQMSHDNGDYLPYDGILEVTDIYGESFGEDQNVEGRGKVTCKYWVETIYVENHCNCGTPQVSSYILHVDCDDGNDGGGGSGSGSGGGGPFNENGEGSLPTDPYHGGGSGGGGGNTLYGAFNNEFLYGALTNAQVNWLNANPTILSQIKNYLDSDGQPNDPMGWYDNYNAVLFARDLVELLVELNYITPIFNYSNYPGKGDGMPFNWWKNDTYLSNMSLDPYDEFRKLTKQEKELVKLFPTLAYFINKNKIEAFNKTQENFPNAYKLNDQADAFRHAYFNALNTKSAILAVIGNGAEVVRIFGEAHESEVLNHLVKEKQMDLYNNNVGINFCSNCSITTTDNQIAIAIMNLLSGGSLMYLFPINYNGFNQTNPPSAFWDNPSTQTLWDGHHGITTSTNMIPTNQ